MKDIFEMAKEAGFMQHLGVICIPNHLALERFAELVRADEREACAKVADQYMRDSEGKSFGVGDAIRARSNT
jgi:predicted ABC-type ATPase